MIHEPTKYIFYGKQNNNHGKHYLARQGYCKELGNVRETCRGLGALRYQEEGAFVIMKYFQLSQIDPSGGKGRDTEVKHNNN